MKTKLRFEDVDGYPLKVIGADGYVPVPKVGDIFEVDNYRREVSKVTYLYTDELVTIFIRGKYE